jgi:hypothetical protein
MSPRLLNHLADLFQVQVPIVSVFIVAFVIAGVGRLRAKH